MEKNIILGCGGTGVEILKLLSITNLKYNITLIDKDIIELSNLNRLFPFTSKDIGCYKASVLSKIYNTKYIVKDILTLDSVSNYDMIIIAVDNLPCRMHLNYLYKIEGKGLLIDCGVSKNMCHVFKMDRNSFCLYCMKEMYETETGEGVSCSKQAEVEIYIRPSVCYINSICASLVMLIITDSLNNYYVYNGTEGIFLSKMRIEKDVFCILCSKNFIY